MWPRHPPDVSSTIISQSFKQTVCCEERIELFTAEPLRVQGKVFPAKKYFDPVNSASLW